MTVFRKTGRGYRLPSESQQEVRFQVVVGETDLWIVADRDLSAQAAEAARRVRGEIRAAAALLPGFFESLSPVAVPAGLTPPQVAEAMLRASAAVGVGPMAAVAGAVAEGVARALSAFSRNVLVENGGDCFLLSERERVIGLMADPRTELELGMRLGLKLPASAFPVAICSSSRTVGHSLSLGGAEIVTILADSGAMADAAATAVGNRLTDATGLQRAIDHAASLAGLGVRGAFLRIRGHVAAWGEIELVEL